MSLTFGQAKFILQPYCGLSGKADSSPELNLFVLKVLQYLLITGSPGGEKTFEFYTGKGYFTAPYELDTPLKIQINGRVGQVVNKWFEFRNGPNPCTGYQDVGDTLVEDPNPYFTAFDGPSGGFQVGVKSITDEDCEAILIVSGNDATGREVFTNHKGAAISGELLEIEKGCIHWSNVYFSQITGITKSPTNGYTPLYWRTCAGTIGLLADYSPVEEVPSYRRFKLNIPDCSSYSKISIIGRTRLKPAYADNDRIPFDTLYNIEVAGQQIQANGGNQIESAVQKDRFLQSLIERESTHKKINNGSSLEVFYPTSAGTVRGLIK